MKAGLPSAKTEARDRERDSASTVTALSSVTVYTRVTSLFWVTVQAELRCCCSLYIPIGYTSFNTSDSVFRVHSCQFRLFSVLRPATGQRPTLVVGASACTA